MGIIRAAVDAVRGGLADQWLEVMEANDMSDTTVMTSGVKVRPNDKRNRNLKGTDNVVSNGSIVHVYPNQFMMLLDGGKVVDYTGEPGYFKVENSMAPSLFNGALGDAVSETFGRIKYGGTTPYAQKVVFINLQEIKNIAFGTPNPVQYFDTYYNCELFLRMFGYFSIRIIDPLKFYAEAIPKNQDRVDIMDIHKLYLSEFMMAIQSSVSKMSIDGIRISHIGAKSMELAQYMSDVLDDAWTGKRGMVIESVGINSISYDEESKKLIQMNSQGRMMSDATIREGFVQSTIAKGLEAAGSNPNGAMTGFMGVGMGMQAGGGFMGAAAQTNQFQMQQQQQQQAAQAKPAQEAPGGWTCACGVTNTGKFCMNCGAAQPADDSWKCSCGAVNTGKFCPQCGGKKPESAVQKTYKCSKCGWEPKDRTNPPKFCPECGDPFNDGDLA